VGHAGTLDPAASGLLVVLVGPATRLEPYLSSASKSYLATITFGNETDTDDAEGLTVRTSHVPAELFSADVAQSVLNGFLGDSNQMPPVYSAIKVGGRTAHKVAREGGEIELSARAIHVQRADLVSIDKASLSWDVEFDVSKGTYIRALARDIGRSVESAAHLSGLRRTSSGPLRVGDAVTLQTVELSGSSCEVGNLFADPVAALGLPSLQLASGSVTDGRPLRGIAPSGTPDGALYAITTPDGPLVAIYRSSGRDLIAEVVFGTPVRRPV
jgi:tRNA pseudouridine55 synthase